MTYEEFKRLANTRELQVKLPNGSIGVIWGHNPLTGDVLITNWPGDAFTDCSTGEVRIEFQEAI